MIRFQVPAEQWSAFIPLRCVIRELDVIYALGQKDSRRSHSVSLFRTQHTLYSGVHDSHKSRPFDSARSVFRTKCLLQKLFFSLKALSDSWSGSHRLVLYFRRHTSTSSKTIKEISDNAEGVIDSRKHQQPVSYKSL